MNIKNSTIIQKKYSNLIETATQFRQDYMGARPFPNIVFENFFEPNFLKSVLGEFPDLSQHNAKQFENAFEKKWAGNGEALFGENTKSLMNYLNSEPFLRFLQELTGIQETLIGDPYYIGGGQHEIKRGGLLKVHVDFNKHPLLGLDRRLNVLIYLNEDWQESFGGHFELWNKSMKQCEKKILPSFNKLAIFSTTDISYHGHPDPLMCPEDRSRKSLALYYYTNGRPKGEFRNASGQNTTIFKQRKNQKDRNSEFLHLSIKNTTKNILRLVLPTAIIEKFKNNNPN
jgi:hypothetical protein